MNLARIRKKAAMIRIHLVISHQHREITHLQTILTYKEKARLKKHVWLFFSFIPHKKEAASLFGKQPFTINISESKLDKLYIYRIKTFTALFYFVRYMIVLTNFVYQT